MQYCTVKDHPDNANDLTGPSRAVSIIKACHDEAEFYPTMKAVVFWQKLSHLVWSTIQVHFNSSSSLIDILTRVHRTANSSISRISAKSLVFFKSSNTVNSSNRCEQCSVDSDLDRQHYFSMKWVSSTCSLEVLSLQGNQYWPWSVSENFLHIPYRRENLSSPQ